MKVYTGKLGQKQRIRIGSKISDSLFKFWDYFRECINIGFAEYDTALAVPLSKRDANILSYDETE